MATLDKDPRALVIVAHPDLHGASRVNRCWVEELERHPDEFLVHDIYTAATDGSFAPDAVAAEQALLAAHELVVFQFPVYWYSCPPLLRAWEDAVYAFGWAYGNEGAAPGEPGRMVAGKRFAYAVSAGDVEEHYHPDGMVGDTLRNLLAPFFATARYLEADCEPEPFAIYGADDVLTDSEIGESARAYLGWLRDLVRKH